METGPPKVITLESDSEDELQILSENIPNYGNYSTLMEVPPELQEIIRISLEQSASLPGKIKTIKVYSTKKNKAELGSVRASFQPSNGQPTQTINVGRSLNAIFSNGVFSNRVKGGGNNNSRKGDTAPSPEKPNLVRPSTESSLKRSRQPLIPDGANPRITERPSSPSSPIILYSPIRKRKSPKPRGSSGRAFSSRGIQQTLKFTHPPMNTDRPTPFTSQRKTISQYIDGENVSQQNSKTELQTREEFQMNTKFPKITRGLTPNDMVFKNVGASFNAIVNPVNLSPLRFLSDNDEHFVEDSILGIWDSPVPSPRGSVDPFQNLELVPTLQENNFNCKESDIISKKDVYEGESKVSTVNVHNVENLANQVEPDRRCERENILDSEIEIIIKEQCTTFESEKQNYNDNFLMPKSVKINVESLPKRFLASSVENRENDEQSFLNAKAGQEESVPPLWTTIFPPCPPSPPPPRWMNSPALFDLNADDFLAVTGLCRLETAEDLKRKLKAPKPLVRVLRKRIIRLNEKSK